MSLIETVDKMQMTSRKEIKLQSFSDEDIKIKQKILQTAREENLKSILGMNRHARRTLGKINSIKFPSIINMK